MQRRQIWGLFFVLPTVIFFAVFFLYPIVSGLLFSLTDFTLLRPPEWVGLQNYADLLKDRLFLKSISVTLGFVLGTTVPVWILSLLAAKVFYQRFAGREILKVLFFAPVLPSLVVVAIVWRILMNPSGVMTTLLRPFTGLGEIDFFNNPTLSPISMILINDWTTIPFYMLIWLAGLTGIPRELRDAALVDGANRWQSFLRIELPLLRPTAVFVAAISTINAFQAFTLQYAISPAGAARSTSTPRWACSSGSTASSSTGWAMLRRFGGAVCLDSDRDDPPAWVEPGRAVLARMKRGRS